jgi:endoglucanase
MSSMNLSFVQARGSRIVDRSGQEVRLRGFSFAGWLNFENFMIGIPGHETGIRTAVAKVLGEEKGRFFFESFLNHYVAEDDFKFMKDLGCNLVRLPFNYRHFESDDRPFEYKEEGFRWFDKAIQWARKYGVYLILDLHAAQGSQNRGFFTDNVSGMAFLWSQKMYQDRAIALWQEIARRYADEPVIAGYDILNEPIPEHISQLNSFYHRAAEAIRKVDKRHILFIEGDGFSTRFEGLDFPFDDNAVYSNHFYSCCGMDIMEYPGTCAYSGRYYDREKLKQEYVERTAYMREHNVPNWFGETSVTYPEGVTKESRNRFLKDMLGIAEETGDSWTFGIYKDLGKTGIVYAAEDSEWVRRIKPAYDAINALHCNAFAHNYRANRIDELSTHIGSHVKEVISGLDTDLSARDITGEVKYFLSECLIPRWLQEPFARQFSGMSEDEIERMMQSFAWKNCRLRQGWADAVADTIADSEAVLQAVA